MLWKIGIEIGKSEMAAHRANIVGDYFKYGESNDPEMRKKAPKLNGKAFLKSTVIATNA